MVECVLRSDWRNRAAFDRTVVVATRELRSAGRKPDVTGGPARGRAGEPVMPAKTTEAPEARSTGTQGG